MILTNVWNDREATGCGRRRRGREETQVQLFVDVFGHYFLGALSIRQGNVEQASGGFAVFCHEFVTPTNSCPSTTQHFPFVVAAMPPSIFTGEKETWLLENHFSAFEIAREQGHPNDYCRTILHEMDKLWEKPAIPDFIHARAAKKNKPLAAEGMWFERHVRVCMSMFNYLRFLLKFLSRSESIRPFDA
jgi:hypothetical protein